MIINRQIGGSGGESASIFVQGLSATDTVTCTKDGKSYSGRWGSHANLLYVLPSGYTQLEYIQSTGTQYINTGVRRDTSIYSFSIDYAFTVTNSAMTLFGSNYPGTSSDIVQMWTDGKIYYHFTNSVEISFTADVNRHKATQSFNGGNGTVVHDSISETKTFTNTYSTTNEYIFAGNNGNVVQYAKARVYSLSVSKNNVLVRNFIPCKRNSDSSIGMYDLVTNEFYGNSGSGTFIAGSEIPSTINGWQFDNLKSYGTYTITSGSQTQNVLVDFATEFDISL